VEEEAVSLEEKPKRNWGLACGHDEDAEVRLRNFEVINGKLTLTTMWCHRCKAYVKVVDR
jgi:hypothetical protein